MNTDLHDAICASHKGRPCNCPSAALRSEPLLHKPFIGQEPGDFKRESIYEFMVNPYKRAKPSLLRRVWAAVKGWGK